MIHKINQVEYYFNVINLFDHTLVAKWLIVGIYYIHNIYRYIMILNCFKIGPYL